MRLAFGGIHIECSTYSRILTKMVDFSVLRGQALVEAPALTSLGTYPYVFLPTLYARAVPGGPVERTTYEALKTEFLESLRKLLPLDGLYLSMHGAMFVEGMEDAEGDWIDAARAVVGAECFISASYDLHGNLSQRVIDNLDLLTAYRTAPHIDVAETQQRACDMLVRCVEQKIRPRLVWVPVPVLLPGERTSTEDEPAKSIYAALPSISSQPGVMDASFLAGYVWADEPRATASVVMIGTDIAVLEEQASALAQRYWHAREEFRFGVTAGSAEQMLALAEECKTQPVILADSGDNPTGGGVGDRAELLQLLLERGWTNTLVAGIADRPATDLCYKSGQGSTILLRVGATLDPQGSQPVTEHAEIIFLQPVDEPRERQAVIRMRDVTIVLTARRRPFHTIRDFTNLQLNIKDYKLLVVKSGYLSPELAPLANPNLMALTHGSIPQDLDQLPENRLRPPSYPFTRSLSWELIVRVKAVATGRRRDG